MIKSLSIDVRSTGLAFPDISVLFNGEYIPGFKITQKGDNLNTSDGYYGNYHDVIEFSLDDREDLIKALTDLLMKGIAKNTESIEVKLKRLPSIFVGIDTKYEDLDIFYIRQKARVSRYIYPFCEKCGSGNKFDFDDYKCADCCSHKERMSQIMFSFQNIKSIIKSIDIIKEEGWNFEY